MVAASRSGPVAQLENKYARLLGVYQVAQKSPLNEPEAAWKADDLEEALAAIQIVIRLWEPDWTPDHIKPIRPKKSFTTHGLQSRLLREFVRTSTGEFSATDAANYLQDRLIALGETPPPFQNMKNGAHQTFRKLEVRYLTALGKRPEKWVKTNKLL